MAGYKNYVLEFKLGDGTTHRIPFQVPLGENGGYYTPKIDQRSDELIVFSFIPSKANMPDIKPVEIKIPQEVDLNGYAKEEWVEKKLEEHSGNVDLTGYATEQWVKDQKYLTEVPEGYAKAEDIPKKPGDIGAQPSGNYALKSEIPSVPVQSVNGKTGAVKLSASDVGARPENWMPSASDVGARPSSWMPSAQDVGALPNTYTPPNQTAEQVGADPKGTAENAISQHNTNTAAHNDLRLELKRVAERLSAFLDSDDVTLDQLSELIAGINSNKTLIEAVTTGKVNVKDIINDLVTNVANKPLSAAQGVVLAGLIEQVRGLVPTDEHISSLIDDKLDSGISGKLDKNQGSGNVGKILVVGTDGNLTLIDMPSGGGDVIGTLDANNNILLSGNLADGTYTLKYEYEDGTVSNVGSIVVSSIVTYDITRNLINCTASGATSINTGGTATVTVSADSGYNLPDSITVSGATHTWDKATGKIMLSNPTGNVTITVVAVKGVTNFADPASSEWKNGNRLSFTAGSPEVQYKALTNGAVTNYVDCTVGDVVRVTGINFTEANNRSGIFASDGTLPTSSNGVAKASDIATAWTTKVSNATYDSNSFQFTLVADSIFTKARFSGLLTGTANDVVINIKRNGEWL